MASESGVSEVGQADAKGQGQRSVRGQKAASLSAFQKFESEEKVRERMESEGKNGGLGKGFVQS